ncbi:transcriptional regulator [Leadbettera azotonutricia ZAS-9]|uniref:Transcriptional regulator n=2 Tax=Leadbettera azotonutricia TaxID=150829 RepID=F5YE69_LEAAZ|nr:transcriptional regulator [Leadbettera azotonutricia ZAS-9]
MNKQPKNAWIFEHFPKGENLKVLELGCGTGLFWLTNRNSIPKTWEITLTDYSRGMLETTKKTLSRIQCNFNYDVVNAENIKYTKNSFDAILANNMLYHIENRQKAISDIYDILKPNGIFIASIMGIDDLKEMHELLYKFLETKGNLFKFSELKFSLNNGLEQLKKVFNNAVLINHENALKINEIEPIINYYLSFNEIQNNTKILPEEYIDEFKEYLKKEIDKEMMVTKNDGIFVCTK